jgi:multidrug efflux pump subunit AcrA (membrane-fusion protein)
MNAKRVLGLLSLLVVVGLFVWSFYQRLQPETGDAKPLTGEFRAIPVEAVQVEIGDIELRRTFSGTLQAYSEFVVAPKVSGRIEQINVDLADMVTRGQVVARLDNDEYVQAVRQAEAGLAVARANLAEAESLLKIAERELERVDKLR